MIYYTLNNGIATTKTIYITDNKIKIMLQISVDEKNLQYLDEIDNKLNDISYSQIFINGMWFGFTITISALTIVNALLYKK